jgi:hypothetical protein
MKEMELQLELMLPPLQVLALLAIDAADAADDRGKSSIWGQCYDFNKCLRRNPNHRQLKCRHILLGKHTLLLQNVMNTS